MFSRHGDLFIFKSQNSLCWIRQPVFFGRQVAKIREKKKKKLAGTYYYLNMAISQFFFLEIWQLSSLFSTKTLCMSPTGFVSGHQVTIISHKKREENAHLLAMCCFVNLLGQIVL